MIGNKAEDTISPTDGLIEAPNSIRGPKEDSRGVGVEVVSNASALLVLVRGMEAFVM